MFLSFKIDKYVWHNSAPNAFCTRLYPSVMFLPGIRLYQVCASSREAADSRTGVSIGEIDLLMLDFFFLSLI